MSDQLNDEKLIYFAHLVVAIPCLWSFWKEKLPKSTLFHTKFTYASFLLFLQLLSTHLTRVELS